jgi:hypothetical protein
MTIISKGLWPVWDQFTCCKLQDPRNIPIFEHKPAVRPSDISPMPAQRKAELLKKALEVGSTTRNSAFSAMMWRFFRRRKYMVDWNLQMSLLFISLGYVAFFMMILIAALFTPLLLQMNRVDQADSQVSEAARHILFLHQKLWPAFVLGLVAVAIHSIRTSHRIAGPLYRFRLAFASMRDGTIPKPVKLRQGDFLNSDMKAVNEMLESLRSRIADIQKTEASLSEAIDGCKFNSGNQRELVSRLDHINVEAKRLSAQVSRFKYEL